MKTSRPAHERRKEARATAGRLGWMVIHFSERLMIELIASVFKKPERHGSGRIWRSERRAVRVDRIKLLYPGVYQAHLACQDADAPHQPDEYSMWVSFRKCDNPAAKLPVLRKAGESMDV